MVDLEDVIESSVSVLDDLWRIDYNFYDKNRMKNLIEMIGNSICLYIQKKIDDIDIWTEDYDTVMDVLNTVT
mgnify:CR=1 FL=1